MDHGHLPAAAPHTLSSGALAVGALAILRYSQILYLLPISLFAMSVAAAELPELSRTDLARPDVAVVRLRRALARVAVLVVPTTVGYLVAGDVVVGALFQTGQFGALDTTAVWIVLCGYALGLPATASSRQDCGCSWRRCTRSSARAS